MKRIRLILASLLLALIMAFGMTATVSAAVKINKKTVTLVKGQKTKLKITGTTKKVNWKSSNKKIATVTTKGVVTAKRKGKATITATVGTKKYKCIVTVQIPRLSKTEITLKEGQKTTLKMLGTDQKVRWRVLDTYNASIIQKGVVTARKKGETVIQATVLGKTYSCTLFIVAGATPTPTPVEEVLEVSDTEVSIGETGDTAVVDITYRKTGSVYYSITDTSIVSCKWSDGWVGQTCQLSITGRRSGKTTIKITNTYNSDFFIINVSVDIDPKKITMSQESITMSIGDKYYINNLNVQVSPEWAKYYYLNWDSDNTDVATVYSGLGYIEANGEGTAHIIVTTDSGKASGVLTVNVTGGITLDLPALPTTLNQYSYVGYSVRQKISISDISYKVTGKAGDQLYVSLCFSGSKLYDDQASNYSRAFPIGYKIYDGNIVMDSGTLYTNELCVGDGFRNQEKRYIKLPKGHYRLELIDVK